MDFALFMERYGYKILLVFFVSVAITVMVFPWAVATFEVFKTGGVGAVGLLVAIFTALMLAWLGYRALFGRISETIYASRQSPTKKEVKRIEDTGKE